MYCTGPWSQFFFGRLGERGPKMETSWDFMGFYKISWASMGFSTGFNGIDHQKCGCMEF
jgi:hypothetical protein